MINFIRENMFNVQMWNGSQKALEILTLQILKKKCFYFSNKDKLVAMAWHAMRNVFAYVDVPKTVFPFIHI